MALELACTPALHIQRVCGQCEKILDSDLQKKGENSRSAVWPQTRIQALPVRSDDLWPARRADELGNRRLAAGPVDSRAPPTVSPLGAAMFSFETFLGRLDLR